MDKGRALGFSILAASGIALMAMPFVFPNIARSVSAVLFDGGSIVAVVSLILLFLEVKERYG